MLFSYIRTSDVSVDPWEVSPRASLPERRGPDDLPGRAVSAAPDDERAAGVALAGVGAALEATRAHHPGGDGAVALGAAAAVDHANGGLSKVRSKGTFLRLSSPPPSLSPPPLHLDLFLLPPEGFQGMRLRKRAFPILRFGPARDNLRR